MMKPNILFLVIDSFRADRFFGKNRSCKTPNIDSLVNQGVYFKNTISSSDVTGICLGNVFSGMYSFKTGLTLRNFNPNVITLFDILKNYGYQLHATIPNLTWFNLLIKNFDDYNSFRCDNLAQDGLYDNVGDSIIEKLSSKKMTEPWLYYIHLEDLHPEIIVPTNFHDKKFGDTDYDKTISSIDYWIGKFIEKVNLENTLIVITADHADPIPVTDDRLGSIPNIQAAMKKGKNKFPILEPMGLKLFILIREISKIFQKQKLSKQLSSNELRTLIPRGSKTLFEETQHIPLLFLSNKIKKSMTIEDIVTGVDILPTILNLLSIKHNDPNLDGRDLTPLFDGKEIDDVPIYIESGDTQERKTGFLIGVRTKHYKYHRARKDSNSNVCLYDMKNDPLEENNIAKQEPQIVINLEKILQDFLTTDKKITNFEISDNEEQKIADELKKLGYLK
jgi:arylsulfatase A-like enzyme